MLNNIPIEDYVMSNKGSIKVNGVEMLELKNCKVHSTPTTKELNAMNCSSSLERKTSYKNIVEFSLNKVTSRFKRTLLENAKKLKETVYDFEGWAENDAGKQEYYRIKGCVFNGEIDWLNLDAEGNYTEEKYSMSFLLENMEMGEEISDGEDW